MFPELGTVKYGGGETGAEITHSGTTGGGRGQGLRDILLSEFFEMFKKKRVRS